MSMKIVKNFFKLFQNRDNEQNPCIYAFFILPHVSLLPVFFHQLFCFLPFHFHSLDICERNALLKVTGIFVRLRPFTESNDGKIPNFDQWKNDKIQHFNGYDSKLRWSIQQSKCWLNSHQYDYKWYITCCYPINGSICEAYSGWHSKKQKVRLATMRSGARIGARVKSKKCERQQHPKKKRAECSTTTLFR